MFLNKLLKTTALFLISLFIYTPISYSSFDLPESDGIGQSDITLSFFDLRDRESGQ